MPPPLDTVDFHGGGKPPPYNRLSDKLEFEDFGCKKRRSEDLLFVDIFAAQNRYMRFAHSIYGLAIRYDINPPMPAGISCASAHIDRRRRISKSPVAVPGVLLAGKAAASLTDRGHSLSSLYLPPAALASLPIWVSAINRYSSQVSIRC